MMYLVVKIDAVGVELDVSSSLHEAEEDFHNQLDMDEISDGAIFEYNEATHEVGRRLVWVEKTSKVAKLVGTNGTSIPPQPSLTGWVAQERGWKTR